MFTPIHRALGLEPGNISINLLVKAVEHSVEETSDLDWKRVAYDSRKPRWDEEAAKDIAAMANSGGGWIVFGIEEDGDKNAASRIAPISWSATDQQRILRAAYAKIGPPVVGLDFHEVPCGNESGGSVVMMRVPDSADAPHFAKKGDDAFVAPRRNGPHTVYMSDREIERGFRERFQHADDQERLLQDRYERACEALRPEDGVFLAVAAIPYEPVSAQGSSSKQRVLEYASNSRMPELYRQANAHSWWDIGEIKKGLRQWVLRNNRSSWGKCRHCLYDDATVLASYRVTLQGGLYSATRVIDEDLRNHSLSEDIEIVVIDFLTLLRSHAQERKAYGGFRIRAGLVGDSGSPIFIRATENWGNRPLGVEYSEPIIRFQPITTELDPLLDIDEILPTINDLALDLINQGGVQYLQVMAEPNDRQSRPE
ncbi:helix-turn-helix domain-containing protein [Cellulomonas flavigena]|uniref:AlbA family DNA-binding domain-containing protein n=1 Tax=Cellulomonas flavigena TaxID=1711 RepID=UPI0009E5A0D4|nr:ATP-binding protein [Cellulomonas flavigena]